MDKLAKLGEGNSRFQLYFFVAVFLGVLALAFLILKPFIYPFILAVIFVALFYPLYLSILRFFQGRSAVSAFIAVILILLLILIPLTLIGLKISIEAGQLYLSLNANGSALLSGLKNFSQQAVQNIFSALNLNDRPEVLIPDLNSYLKLGVGWLLSNLKVLFSSFSGFLFKLVIFLIMLYYLFRYGEHLKTAVIKLSPLPNIEDQKIFSRLNVAIHSILRGSIIIALIQGFLAGLGFAVFGVPQPVLWGSVAAIAALVPSVGTTIVLVPAIVFLWFTGATLPALGLLIWGALAVGLIDNYLSPILIGQGARIHPFLVLLSVLGGIVFFGPIGFLFGPLVLALLFALADIYFETIKH